MIIAFAGASGSGKSTASKICQLLDVYKNTNGRFSKYTDIQFVEGVLTGKFKDEMLDLTALSNWRIKTFANKIKQIVSIIFGCTVEQLEDEEFKRSHLPPIWQDDLENLKTYRYALQYIGTNLFVERFDSNIWIKSLFNDYKTDNKWIISDCRRLSEINAVKEYGGCVVKIERNKTLRSSHITENEFHYYNEYDYIIENNGDHEKFIKQIKKIVDERRK
jgi:hypothetical protein